MIRVWQDGEQWFGELSRDGRAIMNAGPFATEEACRAFLGDVERRATRIYSFEAVNRLIERDPRIGKREARAIHALLRGRH